MSQEQILLDTAVVQGKGTQSTGKKRIGLIVTGIIGGSLVALYAVTAPFVTPALRKICLPFVPATTTQVENVLKVLRTRSGTLVDIGSGDGRIVRTILYIDLKIKKIKIKLNQLQVSCVSLEKRFDLCILKATCV